jgi:hypothetical protein
MYQNLISLEKDNKVKIVLLERRKDIIDPILKVLSLYRK